MPFLRDSAHFCEQCIFRMLPPNRAGNLHRLFSSKVNPTEHSRLQTSNRDGNFHILFSLKVNSTEQCRLLMTPVTEAFEKHCGKREEIRVTIIFNLSHDDFYPPQKLLNV